MTLNTIGGRGGGGGGGVVQDPQRSDEEDTIGDPQHDPDASAKDHAKLTVRLNVRVKV